MANTSNNKNNMLNWILWWQIDQDELNKQVNEYKTLSIFKSARGISFLLLTLSSVVTMIFIALNILDVYAFADIAILMFFAVFTLQGKRWAMIGAMVMWTLEKLLAVSSLGTNAVTSLIWWTAYMHMFYLAYKTEMARKK